MRQHRTPRPQAFDPGQRQFEMGVRWMGFALEAIHNPGVHASKDPEGLIG